MLKENEAAATETVETEQITVDGLNVTIERNPDNTIQVRLPEGLDEAKKADFVKQVETGSKLVGSWYRKNQEANEREKALAEREKAIEEREKALSEGKTTQDDIPLWKKLGLESEEDVEEYAIDNPAKYAKALHDHTIALARAEARKEFELQDQRTRQNMQAQALSQRIAQAGADPKDVEAFAKHYGMPFGEGAFELYAKHNSLKYDPIIDAKMKAQSKQINWIEPGNHQDVQGLIHKMRTNPDAMTDAEIEAVIEARKKSFNR